MKKILRNILLIFILVQQINLVAYSNSSFNEKYSYQDYQNIDAAGVNASSDNEEVLFIVDFSNSMNKKMGYTPKVYHAIDAIRQILRKSGDRTKVGLRIFGVTDKPIIERDRDGYSWHKENLCTASTLVMPIARYNAVNISDKLGELHPQGVSPIGYSLRQAIQNDFSPSAKLKHIILVTDGAENCGDNPCDYIKRIAKLRDDIKIDVIGITVDDDSYSQLYCISEQSKGKYYKVIAVEDFKVKFEEAFYSTPKKQPQINVKKILPPDYGIKYKNFVIEFED